MMLISTFNTIYPKTEKVEIYFERIIICDWITK